MKSVELYYKHLRTRMNIPKKNSKYRVRQLSCSKIKNYYGLFHRKSVGLKKSLERRNFERRRYSAQEFARDENINFRNKFKKKWW